MSQVSPEEAEILLQENRFLKQTILALRNELVNKGQQQDTIHQKSLRILDQQNASLKETVEELRQELEGSIVKSEDETQKLKQIHLNEQKQLKELIGNLRNGLEEAKENAREESQSLLSKANRENLDLKNTISELRTEIDRSEFEKGELVQKEKARQTGKSNSSRLHRKISACAWTEWQLNMKPTCKKLDPPQLRKISLSGTQSRL